MYQNRDMFVKNFLTFKVKFFFTTSSLICIFFILLSIVNGSANSYRFIFAGFTSPHYQYQSRDVYINTDMKNAL